VFSINIETREACGGKFKNVTGIEDVAVIQKIIAHLDANTPPAEVSVLPELRAPP